jgi:hypothetical protein
MIWQEIKIGAFILALCTLAALGTVAIYKHESSTTTTLWLLMPLFALIAIGILASELTLRPSAAVSLVRVGPNASTAILLPIPSALVVATAAVVVSTVIFLSGTQVSTPQLSGPPTYAKVAIRSLDMRQNAALR